MKTGNSPYINRFLSPDTIVPGAANPQAWNRYSYVLGNPLKYVDPSGHGQCQTQEDCDDMGTTPMGTGNPHTTPAPCKKHCGGDPHDDDDYDPNPNGLPGSPECYPGELVCQLAAGGYQVGTGPSPDYFALNGCYGFVFGICAQIVRDYYNNWYWGVGPGLMSGSAYSLNAGWLLQSGRSEEAIQNFTLKWSAFVGGILPMPHPLAGAGAAVTWGDPSLTRPFDYHDLAGEAQVGNAGVTGGLIYDFWIFDSGDPTPWFWQDNDGINNINP